METNKSRFIKFAKMAGFILFIMITIISNVAVWNVAAGAAIGGFEVTASIINFLVEIGVAILVWRKYLKD